MPVDLSVLDEPFPLDPADIAFYRANAFVKLKDVLTPDVVDHFRDVITREVLERNTMHLPMEERSTYDRAFLQVMNLWRESEAVRQLVFSRRLAGIATKLMGVSGVRLYHDQALYKEPGGGFTPWHADQFYWPLSNDNTTTAWIPLQPTPLEMGPLEFSAASHVAAEGRDLEISDDSESRIAQMLERGGYRRVVESFDAGEVSFHAGWLYHRAGPNRTKDARGVMTVIYMDAEMRLKAPDNESQKADWDAWCPGATVGEPIRTPLNPLL